MNICNFDELPTAIKCNILTIYRSIYTILSSFEIELSDYRRDFIYDSLMMYIFIDSLNMSIYIILLLHKVYRPSNYVVLVKSIQPSSSL